MRQNIRAAEHGAKAAAFALDSIPQGAMTHEERAERDALVDALNEAARRASDLYRSVLRGQEEARKIA